MAAGAGTERCSCASGGERAGGIPALRKQQKPLCKPNKYGPALGVLTPPVFVLTGCRAQGNGMGSELPPSLSSACREGLLWVCPFPAARKRHGSDCVSSKHVPSRVHAHTSAPAFLWDDKPRYFSVQTSFREKREDQRHVTVVITSLHALLDNTRSPRQLQFGNGKCLNRTAWSSSPGSTTPSSGCHSSVQAH